ncbi:MAG: DUF2309 family protein [Aquificae bacterium]|nr:DUF2309 family protein [Aquificota bacterium]
MKLGRKLFIRSLVNVASEPISYFWNMRNFVHHNPLHELERLSFEEALKEGERIFGGKRFLSREGYLSLMRRNLIDEKLLRKEVGEFLKGKDLPVGEEEVLELLKDPNLKVKRNAYLMGEADDRLSSYFYEVFYENPEGVLKNLLKDIGKRFTLGDFVGMFFGDDVNGVVEELVIKALMDFLDEGQSVIGMPGRERGLFASWRELARRNLKYVIKGGRELGALVERFSEPEEAIDEILRELELPEELWEGYITLELARIKGFVGYVRWRSHNKHYYFQRMYPADVVELLALLLIVKRGILAHRERSYPARPTFGGFSRFFEENPLGAYLRYEYFTGRAPGRFASLLPHYFDKPEEIIHDYLSFKAEVQAKNFALFLRDWLGEKAGGLSREDALSLYRFLRELEEREGMIWLSALEGTLERRLISGVLRARREEKKPKAQALFCIDVRSERFRRNLEKLGDYETLGIAGFFGVPMAFVELHKGHEEFLCPVLIKPKNVVLEVPKKADESKSLTHVVEEILHDLKQNILTPYITVEAIGFLFGFDFIGKTFFPYPYSRLREKLLAPREEVDYIVDRLSREEINEIVLSVYRKTVRKVLKHELGIRDERITEKLLDEVIEMCMDERGVSEELEKLGISAERQRELVSLLRTRYKIDRGYRNILFERLSRVGFSKEEQALLVAKSLQMVGIKRFAPLVFVVGHGSKSDNNPYESALDCGACGGASGLYNAIVFCRMANDPEVRRIARERFGLDIPQETHFVPALHNTTTDNVEFYDTDRIPERLRALFEEVREDFRKAGLLTAEERYGELFGEENAQEELRKVFKVVENAYDWSQVRPEWGLSGNWAFVVGRRELTKHLNLGGKVFLHSYDYRIDPKGFLLENILSGPMIVGQWINMEHYFSTTDNEVYGSGSKVYHNVVGRFGVVSGNFSDLRTGLPSQTVMRKGEPFHIPVRLIVLIEVPFELGRKVVERVYAVRELIRNGWVNFIIFDPERGKFYKAKKDGWKELEVRDEEA